eukprot:4792665-Prymnesium_polylepis.1
MHTPPYRGYRPQTIRNSLGFGIAPPTASVVGMAIYANRSSRSTSVEYLEQLTVHFPREKCCFANVEK